MKSCGFKYNPCANGTKFIRTFYNFSLKSRHIFNFLLNISHWMSNRHLIFSMPKIQLLTLSPHPNLLHFSLCHINGNSALQLFRLKSLESFFTFFLSLYLISNSLESWNGSTFKYFQATPPLNISSALTIISTIISNLHHHLLPGSLLLPPNTLPFSTVASYSLFPAEQLADSVSPWAVEQFYSNSPDFLQIFSNSLFLRVKAIILTESFKDLSDLNNYSSTINAKK